MDKLAVRPQEAAAMASLSRSFLYEKIASGELRSFRVGGMRLIAVTDLQAWLEQQRAAEPVGQ